jgi:hypothetical protein
MFEFDKEKNTHCIINKYFNKRKEITYNYIFLRIRYSDEIILIPNLIFLLFLIIKWYHIPCENNFKFNEAV